MEYFLIHRKKRRKEGKMGKGAKGRKEKTKQNERVTVFGHKDLALYLKINFKCPHKKFSITNNI